MTSKFLWHKKPGIKASDLEGNFQFFFKKKKEEIEVVSRK